jgi:hypothetical protein
LTAGTLHITEGGVTFNLHANVQPNLPQQAPASADKAWPKFSVKLYPAAAAARTPALVSLTNLLANAVDLEVPGGHSQVQITAVAPASAVLVDGTAYSGYLSSNRHVWAKSLADITFANATQTYALTFGSIEDPVKIGDLIQTGDSFNTINLTDFGALVTAWTQAVFSPPADQLFDINNDGSVDLADFSLFINNITVPLLQGDPLPDQANPVIPPQ